MISSHSHNKKLLSSTIILLAAVLSLVAHPLFAQMSSVQPYSGREQIGQVGELGTTNDFDHDVRLGLQNLAANPMAQTQQKEFQGEEYKSTWDEFGINALIDGATPPAEVTSKISQEIIQTIQTEENYDRQEASYLETAQITPEEVQTVEGSTNSDLPPGESINPNPSLQENPDVNASSVEGLEQNDAGASNPLPEERSGSINEAASASESAPEATTANENTIFEAILQGEQSTPPPSETPAPMEPPPTE